MRLEDINWEYYWDEIKKRKFYIFGIFLVLGITSLENWFIIGGIIEDGRQHEIFPRQSGLYSLMLNALILVIFAVSWDLLSGYSGQVSFGHALFLGMGAYLSLMIKKGLVVDGFEIFPGIENSYVIIRGINLNVGVFYAILAAALIVSGFALFIGSLTLRMEGPYFALVTLVLPLIAIILVTKIIDDYTGGEGGLSTLDSGNLIGRPENSDLGGQELFILRIEQLYYVTLVISIVIVTFIYLLARSRYGMVLKSIREDEVAASASGINISSYKLSAIGLSSFFAAIAGGLYVQSLGSVTSDFFQAERSFEIIIYTILGGIGTIAGSVVGTFILYIAIDFYVDHGFIDLPTIPVLIFGLILILVLRYQPRGLIFADSQVRNALFFGISFSIVLIFYDVGLFMTWMSERFNPSAILQDLFGENEYGLLGMDMNATQGRMVLYFIVGSIIGYFGPDLFQKVRLRVWGVWPSLGDFEPPK